MKNFRKGIISFEDRNEAYDLALYLDCNLYALHPKCKKENKEQLTAEIMKYVFEIKDRHSSMLGYSLKYANELNNYDLVYEICKDFVWLMMDADVYGVLNPYKNPAKLLLPEVKLVKTGEKLTLPKNIVISEHVKDLLKKGI